MHTEERRAKILARIQSAKAPVSGAALAREFSVSRQIVVGDIAILRAMGTEVYATPRGYLIPENAVRDQPCYATIACHHGREGLADELRIIVDHGGRIRDVIVEHPLYGEIRADLLLSTRHEVEEFLAKMEDSQANPLLIITGGVHLHTIEVPDQEALKRIKEKLREKHILADGSMPKDHADLK